MGVHESSGEERASNPPLPGMPERDNLPSLNFSPSAEPYEVFTSKCSEIVIGLVGPLGTDNEKIRRMIAERLGSYNYVSIPIHLSTTVIPALSNLTVVDAETEFDRSMRLIDLGNRIRQESRNNAILAIAAAVEIARLRPDPSGEISRACYIVSSLKRAEEIAELRKIYGSGFYVFAVHTDATRRIETLMGRGHGMEKWQAQRLVTRDEHEGDVYGQDTREAFHLADFFLADENNDDKLRGSIVRSLDGIFGAPHLTPTFNEFAMFMAFASSVRSADLSRQVGAVVAKGTDILSTGANDCPSAGGGEYWPVFIGNKVDDHLAVGITSAGTTATALKKKN